jgi:3-hydroxy-3-methylglutaryl CoA synthase
MMGRHRIALTETHELVAQADVPKEVLAVGSDIANLDPNREREAVACVGALNGIIDDRRGESKVMPPTFVPTTALMVTIIDVE